jgi:hypothetical protein
MTLRWIRHALAISLFPLAGCDTEAAVGPDDSAAVAAAPLAAAERSVDLGACDSLRTPEGSVLAFHAFAEGVQVYRWTGSSWAFSGPIATLYADRGGHGIVGTHFGGPTWRANSGGFIVGALSKRCDVAPADIPWLLLTVVRNEGPGVFRGVTHIQRVNTVGGQFPTGSGNAGEVRSIPYTAEYYFYRAR